MQKPCYLWLSSWLHRLLATVLICRSRCRSCLCVFAANPLLQTTTTVTETIIYADGKVEVLTNTRTEQVEATGATANTPSLAAVSAASGGSVRDANSVVESGSPMVAAVAVDPALAEAAALEKAQADALAFAAKENEKAEKAAVKAAAVAAKAEAQAQKAAEKAAAGAQKEEAKAAAAEAKRLANDEVRPTRCCWQALMLLSAAVGCCCCCCCCCCCF